MEVIREGKGTLFMDPDPDKARQFFKNKDKSLKNKLMSVKEAISKFVNDGDYIAIGGFGGVRIPTALLHEIIRQGKKNLGLSGHTATHDFQILVAGGCFNRCDVAYIVGLEARGVSKNSRRYMETGNVEVTEWSNAGLAWRYKAAALGIPFIPGRSMLGTDTFEASASKVIIDPYTKKPFAIYPALYPDVALIHVHKADVYGNCQIRGIIIADDDLARASKRVIISAERIVSTEEIRNEPDHTIIPYFLVDAVTEVPYGSYPGNMPYEYYSDEEHLREWLNAETDEETFKKFLSYYILESKDFNEYLQKCGGLEKLIKLRRLEFMLHRY